MDKSEVKNALETIKKDSKPRKFKQRIELIINLKGLNLKKPEHQLELYVPLHYSSGKPIKIAAFVGVELKDDAAKVMDTSVFINDFDKYKDKKVVKKFASEHQFFVAQANIMPKVAQTFGKILGTRGKMPNPKAGCVVAPKTNLKPLYDRLQKTIAVKAKIQPSIKVPVGIEGQADDEVIDNVMTIVNAVVHKLPNEVNNIKNVLLKTTMGKPVAMKHT
ncbi:hypothetical protein ACFL0V_02780 [Nanoarchaeota archaeon]